MIVLNIDQFYDFIGTEIVSKLFCKLEFIHDIYQYINYII